jgi:pimeloyl-ACP methyl ester carboxylesterase
LGPERGLFVDTPRLRIHYRTAGEGTRTLVFIHGNYASSRWWIPQLERLPQDYHAFAPDFRGCGSSTGRTKLLQPHRNGRLTIHNLADDLTEFLEALKVSAPIIVAHSFGGLVALEYVVRHQDQVRGLVLEDTGPPNGVPLTTLAEPFFLPLDFGSRRLMKRALRLAGIPRRGELSTSLVEDALAAAPGQYRAFSRAAGSWSIEASLPNLRLPTLLVWGSKDRIMPSRIGRQYLRLIPGSRLVTIPGAGHSPHLERPDAFAAVLREFVGKQATDKVEAPTKSPHPRRSQIKETIARWLRCI